MTPQFLYFIFLCLLPISPSFSLNVTEILIQSNDYKTAAGLITSLGIDAELEAKSNFTLFMPVDKAFNELPPSVLHQFHSLSMSDKYNLMKIHIVRAYYPLIFLQTMKQKTQQTLSSESTSDNSYDFNISVINSSIVELIDTAMVHSIITQTVYSQQPIAIYGVSKVLLPTEIFGQHTYDRYIPLPELKPHLPISQPITSGVSSGSKYFFGLLCYMFIVL
ncbi:hypothetical protein P8452_16717 [Trifolium repens]|jgi:uncharacterized surface protein with fasciclin (FAS1) repeats|nr:fasciclin arabinogalactan protein [Trifolium repens]WJX27944.1 hypothetical protein P8452_16717 [Trifolium repens]